MLRVDPLLFFLLIEALLLSFAGLWFLNRKIQKHNEAARRTVEKNSELQEFVKTVLAGVKEELNRLQAQLLARRDAGLFTEREIRSAQEKFIHAVAESLQKNQDDDMALWRNLFLVFENSARAQLEKITGIEAERLKAIEKCRTIVGGTEKELKRLHGIIKDQEKTLAQLKTFLGRVVHVRNKMNQLIEVTRMSEMKPDMKTEIARIRKAIEMLAAQLSDSDDNV